MVLRELYTHVCFIDPTYLAIYVVLYDDTYVLTFHLCCVDTTVHPQNLVSLHPTHVTLFETCLAVPPVRVSAQLTSG